MSDPRRAPAEAGTTHATTSPPLEVSTDASEATPVPGSVAEPAAGPETRARTGARGPGLRHQALVRVLQVALAVGVVGLWQLFSEVGVLDPFFFSKPSDIASKIGSWVSTGFILDDLAITLEEAALAFVLGLALGLVVGFLLARLHLLAEVCDPFIKMLNALPRVVLAPIFLLWLGLGIWSKVALGVSIVFFIVFFNTYRGVREVDATFVANARMLGASERQLLRHVFLPSALTWIFSSLHISVGFAIVGAVVGEYLGANHGVGYVISQAEGTFDTTGVFAGMVLLMAVVLVVDLGVNRLERFLLRWKPDSDGAGGSAM
jgi:NitT/TauT family transport system permease protein